MSKVNSVLENVDLGLKLDINKAGLEIKLTLPSLTIQDTKAFNDDEISVGLIDLHDTILFMLTINKVIDIADISFNVAKYKDKLDYILNENEIKLSLLLVSFEENKVLAIRDVILDTDFTSKLKELIQLNLSKNISEEKFQKNINSIYDIYSPLDLQSRISVKNIF